MIVLNDDFSISAEQVWSLLNSKIINWLYKSLFETHKVLRADIEALPLHFKYFQIHNKFSDNTYLDYLGLEEIDNGTFRIKK